MNSSYPVRESVGTQDLAELCSKHLGRGRAKIANMFGRQFEERSSGASVYTSAGNRYINCAGYGVLLLGAAHPRVVESVIKQVRSHPISSRVFLDTVSPIAAAKLAGAAPPGLEKVYFTGSGAEAVETAIKLARANGKKRLITTHNGYHGRTMGALSVSPKAMYQDPFRPLIPDVVELPFNDPQALRRVLADGVPSAFIVEPIQGEAGVIIPDPSYLPTVSAACQEFDCFLIIDEILTGLGRVGSWWAISGSDVQPDVLLAGKALSGGVVPVAAAICTEQAYRPFDKDPLLHASTFGGSPIVAAAVAAAIDVIHSENIVERAKLLGGRLLKIMESASSTLAPGIVKEVRGRGLLLGIEFEEPVFSGEMILNLMERNVLINNSVNTPYVMRLTPPALMQDDELAFLENALVESFGELGKI